MRATEIAKLLGAQAERVCQHLLASGIRRGQEWVVGDVDGAAGNSLKVHLSGNKAGVWCDFATSDSGDLIGLWMRARNQNLANACREAATWLGIVTVKVENTPRKWSTPKREGIATLPTATLTWLRTVRKVSESAIDAYRLAFRDGAVMFPYLRDDDLVFAKFRKVTAKQFWTDPDCEPCLFGWQAIPKDARTVVLVEGELDALAMYDYGFPALSVPFGGGNKGKQQWIDNEFDRLANYDEIYLALDQDEPGKQAQLEIVKRLGRERCLLVTLPRKDANQCLMDGVSVDDINTAMRSAKSLDPENLKNANEYADAVWQEHSASVGEQAGIRLPWGKHELLLRPGETSLWAGMSGHGKSQVVGNIAVEALRNGIRVCIASLEFVPPKMLRRLQCQHLGKSSPIEAESRMLSKEWSDKLWVFNPGQQNKIDTLIDTMAYAVRRYGVDLFVIDNLAKLGLAEDKYADQAAFVDRLTDFTRTMQTHAVLVHHVKKTERGEDAPPVKGDIKGSGGITDLVDTVVTVWRNKPKERAVRETNGSDPNELRRPDCILTCHKQRNGDSEPVISLWFDPASYLYRDRRDDVHKVSHALRTVMRP
jgi:twinkle protein